MRFYIVRYVKGFIWIPTKEGLGLFNIVLTQCTAMHLAGTGLRTAITNNGFYRNECGVLLISLRLANGVFYGLQLIAIGHGKCLPAIGTETCGNIFGKRESGGT